LLAIPFGRRKKKVPIFTWFWLVLVGFTCFGRMMNLCCHFGTRKKAERSKEEVLHPMPGGRGLRSKGASSAAPSDGALADELAGRPLYVQEQRSHIGIIAYFLGNASVLLFNNMLFCKQVIAPRRAAVWSSLGAKVRSWTIINCIAITCT
jgi:hypothetical protein